MSCKIPKLIKLPKKHLFPNSEPTKASPLDHPEMFSPVWTGLDPSLSNGSQFTRLKPAEPFSATLWGSRQVYRSFSVRRKDRKSFRKRRASPRRDEDSWCTGSRHALCESHRIESLLWVSSLCVSLHDRRKWTGKYSCHTRRYGRRSWAFSKRFSISKLSISQLLKFDPERSSFSPKDSYILWQFDGCLHNFTLL